MSKEKIIDVNKNEPKLDMANTLLENNDAMGFFTSFLQDLVPGFSTISTDDVYFDKKSSSIHIKFKLGEKQEYGIEICIACVRDNDGKLTHYLEIKTGDTTRRITYESF